MSMIFYLWVTFCPDYSANARCETQRHICAEEVCNSILRDSQWTSAIKRPVR